MSFKEILENLLEPWVAKNSPEFSDFMTKANDGLIAELKKLGRNGLGEIEPYGADRKGIEQGRLRIYLDDGKEASYLVKKIGNNYSVLFEGYYEIQ